MSDTLEGSDPPVTPSDTPRGGEREPRGLLAALRRPLVPQVGPVRGGHHGGGRHRILADFAIGASIVLSYGFTSGVPAVLAATVIIFLTGVPIPAVCARHGVDTDLVTRGAGSLYRTLDGSCRDVCQDPR